jgi:hypothetical protein
MKNTHKKLTALSVIAISVGISIISTSQPASAQVLELATGALSAFFNRPPKPLPNHNFSFGTNNANGNNFNLCLFPCTPGGIPSPVRFPTLPGLGAPPVSSTNISPQGSFSQSRVSTQTGTLPPGTIPPTSLRPGIPVPQGVVPGTPMPMMPQTIQPTPPRPALVVPPIRLPINLPF